MSKHGHRSESAYTAIKEFILRHYAPGKPLVQQELADQLRFSKTPIREALARLTEEGLVKQVTNRGYWMVELSETDIKEIYEVREALEGMAARLAAVKILPDELERLQQLFASIIEDGSVANVEHMEKIGDELHQAILQGAGNARAARLLNLMNGQLDLIRMMGRAVALGTLQARRSALKEHLEILRALANHDPDAAEEAMRRHLRNSKVRILTAQLLPGESFDFLQERSG